MESSPEVTPEQLSARTPEILPEDYSEAARWMVSALCRDRDPELFFPQDGVGVERARRVCAQCPVKDECLEYALKTRQEHGVWGGASERERRRMLRRRRVSGY